MRLFITSQLKKLINLLPAQFICKLEFNRQEFKGFNERPIEYGFVFKCLSKIYPRNVLDIGTGTTALPQLMRNCGFLVTATDNIKDYWSSGMFNRHYYVLNDDITSSRLEGNFDLITCISVLEHIDASDVAVSNMFGLLKSGGHLILTCPYSEKLFVKNVYELAESNAFGKNTPFFTKSFSNDELSKWLKENDGKVIEQEKWKFWDGDYWSVGSQIIPPIRVSTEEKYQLTCLLIQKIAK